MTYINYLCHFIFVLCLMNDKDRIQIIVKIEYTNSISERTYITKYEIQYIVYKYNNMRSLYIFFCT